MPEKGVKNMPEVSVIMPVYNGQKYLPPAVESILAQTLADFEFIVINDGSTDSTAEIFKKYSRQDNRLIIITNHKRLGVARSLNRGLKRARGRYIARMDGDDISEKNRFKIQKDFLDRHQEISMVGTWAFFVDDKGNMIKPFTPFCNHEELYKVIIAFVPFSHGSVMMRTEVFDQKHIKGYNSFFETAEDYDLWVKMMEHYRVANIPEFLYKYRCHHQPAGKCLLQQQKSELIRINAVNLRGLDYQKGVQFSGNWAYRCFFYNYGELLRGGSAVICSDDHYLISRTLDVTEKLSCQVYGVLEEDLTKINRKYSEKYSEQQGKESDHEGNKSNDQGKKREHKGNKIKELLQLEGLIFIIASWNWLEIKRRLINDFQIEEDRIIYSFYL